MLTSGCACVVLVGRWQGIVLISDIIRKEFNADCSVLMGANVANDMGARLARARLATQRVGVASLATCPPPEAPSLHRL